MENGIRAAFGTFPTDADKITSNIIEGGYNLASASNTDAIGLPAVEFLLFRENAKTLLEDSPSAQQYLADLMNKMTAGNQRR